MKKLGLILAATFVASSLTSNVYANDGEALFKSKTCITCHQAGGKGSGPFPELAGLDKAYIVAQFTAIQGGTRGGGMTAVMKANPGVASVKAGEIGTIADYLSALPRKSSNKGMKAK